MVIKNTFIAAETYGKFCFGIENGDSCMREPEGNNLVYSRDVSSSRCNWVSTSRMILVDALFFSPFFTRSLGQFYMHNGAQT